MAATPASAQTGASTSWTGPYVGGQIGVSYIDNDRPQVLFDTNRDGTFNDTVRTAAGANAFSPGFCGEKMWVYLATDLTETKPNPEDDENLEIVRMPLTRALEMIEAGEIEDAKTIIGLTLGAARLGIG